MTPTAPPRSAAAVRRWRRHLADERLEAATYRQLAERRTGEEREILLALAAAESRHAAHWQELLGGDAPGRPSGRSLVLAFLARHVGSVFVLALAERAESRSPYEGDTDATATMAADERVHAEVVRGLAARGRARVSGTFRAAVFGANDGLVSNLALVLGVSAAGTAPRTVLLTALAGLLAGAMSMGAGEFLSVRSQRELLAASTPVGVHAAYPHLDVNANELALVYRARGMSAEAADRHAAAQLDGRAADEQADGAGEDEHELVGTGWGAARSSFAFFGCGAAVPALPYVLGLSGTAAELVACVLVALALLLTGATVGVLSGASPLRRAVRQLAVGAAAAAVTYLLGLLFGATLG